MCRSVKNGFLDGRFDNKWSAFAPDTTWKKLSPATQKSNPWPRLTEIYGPDYSATEGDTPQYNVLIYWVQFTNN